MEWSQTKFNWYTRNVLPTKYVIIPHKHFERSCVFAIIYCKRLLKKVIEVVYHEIRLLFVNIVLYNEISSHYSNVYSFLLTSLQVVIPIIVTNKNDKHIHS